MRMVDVSHKQVTHRTATAAATISFPHTFLQAIGNEVGGNADIVTKKGSVFATAAVAGTMGAKRTSELIPFCHPLPLEDCKIKLEIDRQPSASGRTCIHITCSVATSNKTGVEMEAWTGASVTALTVVDMCKSVTQDIVIENIRLLSKAGGKSDFAR